MHNPRPTGSSKFWLSHPQGLRHRPCQSRISHSARSGPWKVWGFYYEVGRSLRTLDSPKLKRIGPFNCWFSTSNYWYSLSGSVFATWLCQQIWGESASVQPQFFCRNWGLSWFNPNLFGEHWVQPAEPNVFPPNVGSASWTQFVFKIWVQPAKPKFFARRILAQSFPLFFFEFSRLNPTFFLEFSHLRAEGLWLTASGARQSP